MLGDVFERFVAKSPISVMVRGRWSGCWGADQLDRCYEHTAQKQYTRDLLFSTVYNLMRHVVLRISSRACRLPGGQSGDRHLHCCGL